VFFSSDYQMLNNIFKWVDFGDVERLSRAFV
jgi:hypothetical protein